MLEEKAIRSQCVVAKRRSDPLGVKGNTMPHRIEPGVQEEIVASSPIRTFTPGKFLEIFIGSGILSTALHREAGDYVQVLSMPGTSFSSVDVSSDHDFEMLLDESALWKHMAPPCKSFSRARRTDQVAVVKTLRSDSRPEGYGCSMTKDANKLVERCVEIARQQLATDTFFSIENPWNSFLWDLRCVRALLKSGDVQLKRVDQCTGGSQHLKPTGILTNAPWLKERRCDKETRPHHHVPLMGLVQDFRTSDAKHSDTQCFYTELAAEYPEGLCNVWARGFRLWIQDFIVQCMSERSGEANTQWTKNTGENHAIQGLGGLSAAPAARASTDHSPCLHSGVGIVGEFVRHGKFLSLIHI